MTSAVVLTLALIIVGSAAKKPHVVFFLVDDLGWNDVGFHGSDQIPTPNIDALAYNGVILNNYYVYALCTPSRSALMTGRYATSNGMQVAVLFGAEARGLPLDEKLMPQYLNDLGYESHMVGKWNLGNWKKEYTPTYRGFKTHLGYWTGHQDYYDHTAQEILPGMDKPYVGLDMRRGLEPAWDLHGQYSTHIYTNESVSIISNHNSSNPLFLYLAHVGVHSGGDYNPLPAPDSTVEKFQYIDNYNRSRFAAILSEVDESLGQVIQALKDKDMLKDSIIVFSTDNGGGADGYNLNYASNWPLRGVKSSLFEGGVRGAAAVWSPNINGGRVSNKMMHISDWMPTLYSAAGGNVNDMKNLDGFDMWDVIREDKTSPRTRVIHNIDNHFGVSGITIGKWKLIQGTYYDGLWDGWYGPSGKAITYSYKSEQVLKSQTARLLQEASSRTLSTLDILALRTKATVKCPRLQERMPASSSDCQPLKSPCLFNIQQDPCELTNLAKWEPAVLKYMQDELKKENETVVPPANLPWDPNANPALWDHTWINFGDYAAPEACPTLLY